MFATKRFRTSHPTAPAPAPPTLSRGHTQYSSDPPPAGSDSCYGVRSLESSVSDWDAGDAGGERVGQGEAEGEENAHLDVGDNHIVDKHAQDTASDSDSETEAISQRRADRGGGMHENQGRQTTLDTGEDIEATPTPSYAIPQHSPSDSLSPHDTPGDAESDASRLANLQSPVVDASSQRARDHPAHGAVEFSPYTEIERPVDDHGDESHESGIYDTERQRDRAFALLPPFASPPTSHTPSIPAPIPLELALALRDTGAGGGSGFVGGGVSSEPSSPASFTSLPSYVASISSVSRTSSPGPGWGNGSGYGHVHGNGSSYSYPYHRPSPTTAPADHSAPLLPHERRVQHHSALGMELGSAGFEYDFTLGRSGSGGGRSRGMDAAGTGQSQELVLPMLSLPDSSLHLSFPRLGEDAALDATRTRSGSSANEHGSGTVPGVRMALVASADDARLALRDLAETERIVEVHRHELGVVRNGKIVATILTGLSAPQVTDRVGHAYTALDGLLHPALPTDRLGDVQAMVDAYSTHGDWVHLVVAINNGDHVAALTETVPTAVYPTNSAADPRLVDLGLASPQQSPQHSSLPAETNDHLVTPETVSADGVEPTPRVSDTAEAESYFPPLQPVSETSPSLSTSHVVPVTRPSVGPLRPAAPLIAAIDRHVSIRSASVSCFLAYRTHLRLTRSHESPNPNLVSGTGTISTLPAPVRHVSGSGHGTSVAPSSPSPVSSSLDVAAVPSLPPMPTVSRAHGGGEWEATLSRRLAHRREMDAHLAAAAASRRGRGGSGTTATGATHTGRDRGSTGPPSRARYYSRRDGHSHRTLVPFTPDCAALPLFPASSRAHNAKSSPSSKPSSPRGSSNSGSVVHRVGIARNLVTKAFVAPFTGVAARVHRFGWGRVGVVVACATAAAAAVAIAFWVSARTH